ncbi:hypothetical protein [uncultured Veillonella sp.]|uniref:hypothetical protein n=1 Tax=uncultured Veillonella sp. TaxID=159268 RepID=UPI0028DB81B2|nr:hypothetical protein [uncultured Veillonella sp.]
MGEAKQAFIKPYEDLRSNYTRALSTILPEQWISNDENKALQKKYLGYYSFKEIERPFTEDYKFYIFKFDYSYGGYVVAGMAVNPEQTRLIYFIHTIR